tara:strand:+ start:4194 stop:4949 length:756 start_codon:yes stop_codon:yes gene_type:complete
MLVKNFSLMQPTFFPWIGYFLLIKETQKFCFFDTAQFSRFSWHHRNKLNINGKELLISLPIKHLKKTCSLKEASIAEDRSINKLIKTLNQNFPKSNLKADICELIQNSYFKDQNLGDANVELIKHICEILYIETKLFKSSELDINLGNENNPELKKFYQIISIGKYLKANYYLSPSSADYLFQEKSKNLFKNNNIQINSFEYVPNQYEKKLKNKSEVFLPYMSILDLILNNSIEYSRDFINSQRVNINKYE